MLLALDVGNTSITFGVFDGGEADTRYAPKATWRIAADSSRMADDYGLALNHLLQLRGLEPGDLTAVAICSVVPPLTPTFVDLCRTYFKVEPLVIGAGVKTGIKILYDNPRDVGADRIADAAAALDGIWSPGVLPAGP